MNPPKLLIVGATGWFGRTLVHEYVSLFGRHKTDRLKLYGSRRSTLRLDGEFADVQINVEPLSSIITESVADYEGLIWYAFLLRNKINEVGLHTYRRVNDEIARHVFHVLERNPGLACVFASSGTIFGHDRLPDYEDDPYSFLKLSYERRLRNALDTSVVYPYAATGMYLPDPQAFALGSFVQQLLSSGSIVIDAPVPVVRSYGSVHDLSRYLLTVLARGDRLPSHIVPVTCTVDLLQLAVEVSVALGRPPMVSTRMLDGPPNTYVATEYGYVRHLAIAGLPPTALADQIRLTAQGAAFRP